MTGGEILGIIARRLSHKVALSAPDNLTTTRPSTL
jgi:hypothetical protein